MLLKRVKGKRYKRIVYGKEVFYVSPMGIETYLYSVGTLAKSVGRKSVTVRRWEKEGIIPKTPFRDRYGIRLYPREYLDLMSELARELRISRCHSARLREFSLRVYEGVAEINKKLFGENYESKKSK